MALKFLNKKGWHTGSLRNIENVWKAEQKHDAEQRKLEELRKQIQEDHEKAQFRLLQEQAGLVPRQERLDFLYESGLAVGKGSSEGFKALQAPAAASASASAASTGEDSSSKAAVPGALFEDKPQSANDAWRKLHSDPLLLIRQREQEALDRIKNNPIKMAMIKKSVEAEKNSKQEKDELKKKRHKGHHHSKSNNGKHSSKAHSDPEDSSDSEEEKRKIHHLKSKLQDGKRVDSSKSGRRDHDNSSEDDDERRRKGDHKRSEQQADGKLKYGKHTATTHSDSEDQREERVRRKSNHSKYESYHHHNAEEERRNRDHSVSHHHHSSHSRHGEHSPRVRLDSKHANDHDGRKGNHFASEYHLNSELGVTNKRRENDRQNQQPSYNRRGVPKMSEEERAARLKEMQADAELHEEQRWKRLKKAAENDAQEAKKASFSRGKNFLDDAQKSVYGAEKGGSVTIEESVRRRAFYSQGSSAHESNAFRR